MKSLFWASFSGLSLSYAASIGSDACLDCTTETCALLPPDGSSFPCYEGSIENANKCYSTDPLLAEGTSYKCSTCAEEGYTVYLQNDPIYRSMELWTKAALKTARGSDYCLDCENDVCAIIPPSGSSFPCYQGNDENSNFCYNTDPLIDDASTYVCDTCASAGYTVYLQNDPIYKNMELWSTSSLALSSEGACSGCSGDLCSILPPAGSHFPCYQGTVAAAEFCFSTDPLLKANSTTSCNSCTDEGYDNYMQNDPIYKNMELWGHGKK